MRNMGLKNVGLLIPMGRTFKFILKRKWFGTNREVS